MDNMELSFFHMCIAKKESKAIRTIIRELANIGFNECKLWFYLGKWAGKGFYRGGAEIDLGELIPEKFTGQYREVYNNFVQRWRSGKTNS